MQQRYFYSRLVVYYTCKTLFILNLQTHLARNVLCQNHENIVYFHCNTLNVMRTVFTAT